MVGGGSKRDEGLPAISSTNIFSALESRRKKSIKKRLDKDQKGSSLSSASNVSAQPALQSWAPTPVSVTSWADCEEDDDDYFAMPALAPLPDQELKTAHDGTREEEEEEEDMSHGEESEGDEDVEEEGNEENEEPQCPRTNELAADVNVVPPAPVAAREPDRQLSKKQLKKKELAELEAVLAELGLNQEDKKEAVEVAETKGVDAIASVNDKEESGPTMAESKSSKRRKAKREKSFKEGKEEEGVEETDGLSKDESAVEYVQASSGPVDRSEMFKKLSSMKKKKSFKESDSAAKAAAAEAAARAVKLAAAKKKEKAHYNQQPVR